MQLDLGSSPSSSLSDHITPPSPDPSFDVEVTPQRSQEPQPTRSRPPYDPRQRISSRPPSYSSRPASLRESDDSASDHDVPSPPSEPVPPHSEDTPIPAETPSDQAPAPPDNDSPRSEDVTTSNGGTWKSSLLGPYLSRFIPSKLASGTTSESAPPASQSGSDSGDDTEIDDEDNALLAAGEPAPTMVAHRRSRSRGRRSRSLSHDNELSALGTDIESQSAEAPPNDS